MSVEPHCNACICQNIITPHWQCTPLQNHQLNALFVEGPHKISVLGEEHNGTWVGSMGFKVNGQKVQIDTDDEGVMTGEAEALSTKGNQTLCHLVHVPSF